MVRRFAGLLVSLLLSFAAAAQVATGQGASAPKPSATIAGKVELVEGEVTVYDRAKTARRVRVGESLNEGDGVVTGRDGELHVAMDDGGYLAIRPNTNMSILAYQAQGREDDRSILNLLAGSFRSVTGWIGRHNPKSYQVRTPTATIGIRGTDHEPLVVPEGARDAEPGTYDKVNAGGTVIESVRGQGRIEVTPNRAGFAPLRGQAAPRLLAEVPRVYRPTRNEGRLLQKHQAAQKTVDRLRDDRRRQLQERRREIDERKDARKAEFKRDEERRRKDVEERRGGAQDERKKHGEKKADEQRQSADERRREQQERKADERRREQQERKADERKRERDKRDDSPRGRDRD